MPFTQVNPGAKQHKSGHKHIYHAKNINKIAIWEFIEAVVSSNFEQQLFGLS